VVRNARFGAGRAIPGAKAEWPRRVHSGPSAAVAKKSATCPHQNVNGPWAAALDERLMTTRRRQTPPSPLQISAPFCPLLCGAIARSQPLTGTVVPAATLQQCITRSGSQVARLGQQLDHFRHRSPMTIRAGRPLRVSRFRR